MESESSWIRKKIDWSAPVIDKTAESSSKTVINRFVAERLLEAADLPAARQDEPFRTWGLSESREKPGDS